MNSVQEAASKGVPVIPIPLFADQYRNAKMLEYRKTALALNAKDLTVEKLTKAINEIIEDDRYHRNAKKLAAMIAAKPMSAEERVVRYTEFAAQFGPDLNLDITIVDLGCGPGNSTKLLFDRWPNASITGVDSSADMITKAKEHHPMLKFEQGDAGAWLPQNSVDLIFANALFQWIPNHLKVFQNLIKNALKPNGVLAIQMPDNFQEPTHVLMREVAQDKRWYSKLQNQARTELPNVNTYYNTLLEDNLSSHVDIWHTIYYHPLDGPSAIVEWLKGTGLRPFLDPLDEDGQREFIQLYTEKLTKAYEPCVDGKVLLRYPRIFIVAQKSDQHNK
uniref:glucuronosyltransferase n=1 Tax=Acrobeloides nanus TaxID=290746 RepID=A0A914CMK0_9BILA